MNDDIEVIEVIEGQVIEPGSGAEIEIEVKEFQQRMDELKGAYLEAADLISQGAVWPSPEPEPTEQSVGKMMVQACGKTLIAVGTWMVSRVDVPAGQPEDAETTKTNDAEESGTHRPLNYPPRLRRPQQRSQGGTK